MTGESARDEATKLAKVTSDAATRVAASPAEMPERLGPYRLLRRLGGGGMGHIYLASQDSIGRMVALKVLKAGFLDDATLVERFQRELQVLGQLSHPHICPVLEAGSEGSHHYYAMEYLRGADLARVMKTQRVDARRAATIASQVARALQFAHERRVVHRDVKPLNIMLSRGKRRAATAAAPVKSAATTVPRGDAGEDPADPHLPSPEHEDHAVLIDFGLARDSGLATSRLTVTGEVIGTPAYMAPEQARGDQAAIGPATDIYALGATLYEMLTLRPPFERPTVGEIIHDVIYADPTPVRKINALVDRDLETIVQKAMEKDPARRFASASDLADDLDRWLAGEAIRARRASLAHRLVRFVARNRAASATAAAALLLGAWGFWHFAFPGTLDIRVVSPPGARVLVNGAERPAGKSWVWPGEASVSVLREGFDPWAGQVVVPAHGRVALEVTLISSYGTLSVDSEPGGARVWLDREEIGVTPIVKRRVRTGAHAVEIRREGHEAAQEAPFVMPDAESVVRHALRHEQGSLTLTSEPTVVAIEAAKKGTDRSITLAAPADALALDTGDWKLTARARNRFSREFPVSLLRGAHQELHVTLNPLLRWEHPIGRGHRCTVAGDLDGDQLPDLVIKSGEPQRITALSGSDGRLLWVSELGNLRSTTRHSLVLADFDGDLDIEVAYPDLADGIVILEGSTGRPLRRLYASGVEDIYEAGDLDGDAGPDLVCVRQGSVLALEMRGGLPLWTYPATGSLVRLRCGFLNAGDVADVVVVCPDQKLSALDGSTGLPLWSHKFRGTGEPQVTDLDGDGRDDVVVADREPASLVAYAGPTGRQLWRTPAEFENLRAPDTSGDLDGDGIVEIVRNDATRLLVFDGRTGALESEIPIPNSWGPSTLVDVNADGRLDVLVPSLDTLTALDGTSRAPLWTYYAGGPISDAPLLADFDGDGRQDLALTPVIGLVAVLSVEEPPILWKQSALQYSSESPIPLPDGRIAVPGLARLHVLRASDGLAFPLPTLSPCDVGTAAVTSAGPRLWLSGATLRCVDLDSGKELWEANEPAGLTAPDLVDLDGDGNPELVSGELKGIAAVDGETGKRLWRAGVKRTTRARAAMTGGSLLVPGFEGVHVLDPLTGEEKRHLRTNGIPRSVRAAGADVVTGTSKGFLVRMKASGDIAWQAEFPGSFTAASPIVAGQLAAGMTSNGLVVALDVETGAERWRVNLDATTTGGPSAADIDADGWSEIAVVTDEGLVVVLSGLDGRTLWSWRLDAAMGAVVPRWFDADADGRPELLVHARDGYVYAFRITPRRRAPLFAPSRDHRSPAVIRAVTAAHEARRDSLAAWHQQRWDEVIRIAGSSPSPLTCGYAALAASRARRPDDVRRWAADAAARGCRRIDIEILRAAQEPGEEGARKLADALKLLPLEQLRIYDIPEADRALVASALPRVGAVEPERLVALAALLGPWEDVHRACTEALASGASQGRISLARARAALRLSQDAEVVPHLRQALADPAAIDEARLELERLNSFAADLRRRGAIHFNARRHKEAVASLHRATILQPDLAGNWNDYAYFLAASPDASRDDGLLALDAAQRAVNLHKAAAPGDLPTLAIYLDSLALACFLVGNPEKALRIQEEALALPVPEVYLKEMEERREQYRKAAGGN